MSDRRPEKPELYVRTPCEHPEATGLHTSDGTTRRFLTNPPDAVCAGPSYEPIDPVAAVRRGVESGTIEGEVLMEVTEKNAPVLADGRYLPPGTYLVIPVDGEENG